MREVVGVQYKKATKIYYFDPKDKKYHIGDEVIVDTANGNAYGVIAQENKFVKDSEIEAQLKPVLRLITESDIAQIEKIRKKAEKSYPVIIEKINKLKLNMKVVEVEYTLDESKVTISYTSEDRVDFRELLKLLAGSLRVKIELRQIGIRDEVKAVGGLGLCGMECCCRRFLKDAEHVVVKMAKNQNLSMSPTKTGGACGKMMCCLAYEDQMYRDVMSKMPKVGSKIKLADGTHGVVQSIDCLKEVMTVKVFQPDETYKFKECTLADLKVEDNCKKEHNNETSSVKTVVEKKAVEYNDNSSFCGKPQKNFSGNKKNNKHKNFKNKNVNQKGEK